MRRITRFIVIAIVCASAAPGPIAAMQDQPDAEPQQQRAPALHPKIRALQALLYTTLGVEFDETPAREAFDAIEAMLGVPIIGRYSDDAAGFGIDPQAPITLRAQDTEALHVLEMVLEQCALIEECTWQVRMGSIEVGTKERLSMPAAQHLRVYPVGDLLHEAPDFEGAPTFRLEDELGRGVAVWPRSFRHRRFFRGVGGAHYPWPAQRLRGLSGAAFGGYQPDQTAKEREEHRAEELVELITTMIEPAMWEVNGGSGASIEYRDSALVVRAPDFVHRQLAGYPPVPPPANGGEAPSAPGGGGGSG